MRISYKTDNGSCNKILPEDQCCQLFVLPRQAREYLISIDTHNQTLLETIQSSLFVLSLDDAKPYSTPDNYTNVPPPLMLIIYDIISHFSAELLQEIV